MRSRMMIYILNFCVGWWVGLSNRAFAWNWEFFNVIVIMYGHLDSF